MNDITYTKTYTEKGGNTYEVEITYNEISDQALDRYVEKLIEISSKKDTN